jgi:Tfp pilus assembly protein PilF
VSPPPNTRSAVDLINEAVRLQHAANYVHSEMVLRAASQAYPRNADVHFHHGWVLGQMCREAEGIAALKRAVALEPQRAQVWHEMGMLHQNLGEPAKAVECFERAMFLNPKRVETYCAASVMLERDRKPEKARAVLEKGLLKNPGDPQVRMMLAQMDARSGKADEAATVLREVIETAPSEEVRCRAYHALSVALEELKRHEEAWAAATSFNAIRRTLPSVVNALAGSEFVVFRTAASYTGVSAEQFQRWKSPPGGASDGLPEPSFLVGFPRSGTTMTENALGAHPRVIALDEPPTVNELEHETRRILDPGNHPNRPHAPERFAELLDAMTAEQWHHLRAFYWKRVKEVEGPHADAAAMKATGTLLLDKNPFTIYRVALLNRLFPHGKVVCVIRDPRDCCISCFMQFFRANPAMVLFTEINDTARTYAAVMSQWLFMKPRLSMDVLQVRYEDTVNDFETYARQLIAFMGLEWDDTVLSFQKKAGAKFVSTPSFRAVTEKVNTKAVARWKRYGGALDGVLPVLQPFIKEFGYE